jgi:hypothetical protein
MGKFVTMWLGMLATKVWVPQVPFWDLGNYEFTRSPCYWPLWK